MFFFKFRYHKESLAFQIIFYINYDYTIDKNTKLFTILIKIYVFLFWSIGNVLNFRSIHFNI